MQDDILTLSVFWAITLLLLLVFAFLQLRDSAQEWLAENDVMYPTYPWYVRLDHWFYHCEACRVQRFVFEQHAFFGARVRVLGQFIHSM